jgi:hypothetical protein
VTERIAALIEQAPSARLDRCNLIELSPAGLVLELVYFLEIGESPSLPVSQQRINLAILALLEELGVSLADGPLGLVNASSPSR